MVSTKASRDGAARIPTSACGRRRSGSPLSSKNWPFRYHQLSVGYDAFRKQAYSAGRAAFHLSRKHALPLADLSPTETGGWLSGLLTHAWRVSPVAADTAGHLMTGGLWLADRLGLRPVQIVFAQLVRRIYKVGGITLETLEQSRQPSLVGQCEAERRAPEGRALPGDRACRGCQW